MRIQTALASALLASACTAAAPDALPVWKTKELPAVARARSWEDLLTRDFPTSRPVETLSKPATTGGDYRVVNLTSGPGVGVAWKVNSSGSVVGAKDYDTTSRAFLYRRGEMIDFNPAGSDFSMASELNERGQVTVVAFMPDFTTSGFLFTPTVANGATGKWTALFSGMQFGIPAALNEAGQVSGMFTDADGREHAFLWTPSWFDRSKGIRIDIPLPAGASGVSAAQLNAYGQVAGTYRDVDYVDHVFLWTPFLPNTPVGLTVDLGVSASNTFLGNPVFGRGLNNSGQVIFERPSNATDPSEAPIETVVFSPLRPNGYLGTFVRVTDTQHVGTAFSINDAGQVSLVQGDIDGSSDGLIYTPGATRYATPTYAHLGTNRIPFTLNSRGQAAGSSDVAYGSAFLWSPTVANGTTGTTLELASLSEGCGTGIVFFLNDQGQAVGECLLPPGDDPEAPQALAAVLITNR